MAIQAMSATLVQDCYEDKEGRFHMVNLVGPIVMPYEARERLRSGSVRSVKARLPDFKVVLVLWGGEPGQVFKLSGALTYPAGGPSARMPVNERTWPVDNQSMRIVINFPEARFDVKDAGVYKLKFLIDGQPLTELPLPILWPTDPPR